MVQVVGVAGALVAGSGAGTGCCSLGFDCDTVKIHGAGWVGGGATAKGPVGTDVNHFAASSGSHTAGTQSAN